MTRAKLRVKEPRSPSFSRAGYLRVAGADVRILPEPLSDTALRALAAKGGGAPLLPDGAPRTCAWCGCRPSAMWDWDRDGKQCVAACLRCRREGGR